MNKTASKIITLIIALLIIVGAWGYAGYSGAQSAAENAWKALDGLALSRAEKLLPLTQTLSGSSMARIEFQEGFSRYTSSKDQFDRAMAVEEMIKAEELLSKELSTVTASGAIFEVWSTLQSTKDAYKTAIEDYKTKAFEQQRSLLNFPSSIWGNILGTEPMPGIK